MRQLANTLYITSQGAYLRRDHQTLQVRLDGKARLTVPLHHLDGVVCFGRVSVSPGVWQACGEHGLAVSFLTEQGRFLARVEPPTHGNVLLRRQQYRLADDPAACLQIATPIIAAKIQNARNLLLRSARDSGDAEPAERLRKAARHMAAVLAQLPGVSDLDTGRGIEGETARTYFEAFEGMIRQAGGFTFSGRNRRPPRDPVNAMLSFAYALLSHDCASALQAVGLDSSVGFLHADRPGRPSSALDLMEEFRALIADRLLILALINRRQVQRKGFTEQPGGAVIMDDTTRRTLATAARGPDLPGLWPARAEIGVRVQRRRNTAHALAEPLAG